MKQEIASWVFETLQEISEGRSSYRDLAKCLTEIESMIIVTSSGGWQNFFGDLDNSLAEKGYGNVKMQDAREPQPLGLESQDGKFFPYIFTHHDIARHFAIKKGIIKENENLLTLSKSWSNGLYTFLTRKYGGLVLDEGSTHRIVLKRFTIGLLYALITLENFSSLPAVYLITDGNVPLIKEQNQKMAYCYDSRASANIGLQWLQKNGVEESQNLVISEFTIETMARTLLSLDVTELIINHGLPDERNYFRQDLEIIYKIASRAETSNSQKKGTPETAADKQSAPDMAEKNAQTTIPTDLVLVPDHEGDFLSMWGKLASIFHLHIPIGLSDGTTKQVVNEEEGLSRIGNLIFNTTEGLKIGLVYTDPRVFKPQALITTLSTWRVLDRFFHDNRVQGVAFNLTVSPDAPQSTGDEKKMPDLTYPIPYSYTIFKFAIPRLIGLVKSDDPLAGSSEKHSDLAAKYLARDQIYQAFHHAASAREAGEPLDSCYFIELDALISLNLKKEVAEYLAWYEEKGQDPRYDCYYARALNLSGKPDDALKKIKPFLEDPDLGAFAWLERGRALFFQKKIVPAINAFNECLFRNPGNVEALLGLGIATRTQYYDSRNEKGLMGALDPLQKVADKNGYHAPEALFHIGTIYVALAKWRDAELIIKKSLDMRDTAIARRNLILTLHAQGRIDEAYLEYQNLLQKNPQQAEGLDKYFTKQ